MLCVRLSGFCSPTNRFACLMLCCAVLCAELSQRTVAATAKDCKCKPGYGSRSGEGPCHVCGVGTYSQGGSLEDCKACPFGYTSAPGATSGEDCKPVAQTCPVGQTAPSNAVSQEQCGCLPGFGGVCGSFSLLLQAQTALPHRTHIKEARQHEDVHDMGADCVSVHASVTYECMHCHRCPASGPSSVLSQFLSFNGAAT